MNRETRLEKIASYEGAYIQLQEFLQGVPPGAWHFRSPADPWTIHETVVHITDSEANSYVRCRRAIAESGQGVMAYDENQWAKALHYADQNVEEMLQLFRLLRLSTARLIASLSDNVWSNTIEHPENGTMSLDDWLGVYARHIPDHLQQMQAILADWRAQQSS